MSKPYRERAELFAQNPQGRIYGGFYPGQGFGTFGGGVDPGEDPQEAAAREFQEESGYPVSNVRPAPVDPYVEDWKAFSKKPEYANDPKFQERFKKFKGSRTHYFLGDIAGKRESKGSNDAAYPFESVRFRAAPTVISKHEKDLRSLADPIDIARLQQRLAVLQSLQEKNAMPFKSKSQQRFMFASEAEGELPKGTAKRWAHETEKKKGGIEALPEKVKPKMASLMADASIERFLEKVAGAGGLAAALSAIGSGKPEKSQLKEAKMKKSAWKIAEELYTPEDVEWANEFGRLSPEEQRKRSPNPNLPLRIIHAGGAAGQEDLPLEDMREMMKDWNYKSKEAACATPGKKIRSEGKGQGLARGKGKGPVGRFKKKAAEIAEMIIQKNAASSTDFIDKMRSKKEAGCSSSSSKPKKMKKSPKEIANKVWSSKKK